MMKLSFWRRLTLCLFGLAIAPTAAWAEIYVKMPPLEGESAAEGREDWIEVISFQWGVSNSGTIDVGGGGGAGRATASEVTLTKYLGRVSPTLMQRVATGANYGTIEIEFANSAPEPFVDLKVKLTDAIVTGYSISSGGDQPSESFSIAFGKIEMTYLSDPRNGQGTGDPVTGSFDFAAGTP